MLTVTFNAYHSYQVTSCVKMLWYHLKCIKIFVGFVYCNIIHISKISEYNTNLHTLGKLTLIYYQNRIYHYKFYHAKHSHT
jgi:hypothetical protein